MAKEIPRPDAGPDDGAPGAAGDGHRAPPGSVGEALGRARRHARAATGEALLAVHALLDAGSLAASGEPSEAHRFLAPLAALLEGLGRGLEEAAEGRGSRLLEAVAEALDVEIARWEARARDDPEARAVLRAFLGLRELLWELGVRRGEPGAAPDPGGRRPPRRRGPRVQRVPVEG